MGAAFALELDTTPPQLTSFGPARIDGDEALLIPYAVDEDGVVEASLVGVGDLEIGPSRLRLANGPRYGTVQLVLRDDVDNEQSVSVAFSLSSVVGRQQQGSAGRAEGASGGRVAGAQAGRAASAPGPRRGSVGGGRSGSVS
jgi:hypothetical protein